MNRRCATACVAASGAAAAAALATTVCESCALRAAAGRAASRGTCMGGGRRWHCDLTVRRLATNTRENRRLASGLVQTRLAGWPFAHCGPYRTECLHAAELSLLEAQLHRHWPLHADGDCLHGYLRSLPQATSARRLSRTGDRIKHNARRFGPAMLLPSRRPGAPLSQAPLPSRRRANLGRAIRQNLDRQ